MPERRISGWKKDKRDERDRLIARAVYLLPESVSLEDYLPPVRDQGNLGACVGFGIGGNITGSANKSEIEARSREWTSPLWLYNGARMLEQTLYEDSGAFPRDALEFARAQGCLPEHCRPYTDRLDTTSPLAWVYGDPPGLAKAEAAKWPLLSYARCVDGAEGIKAALAAGYLVSIGAPWFAAWSETNRDGILPETYGFLSGGHEFLCYGYDDVRQLLFCQNSWGRTWGKEGRFAVPYSAIDAWKSNGGYDAHTVTVQWAPAPQPDPGKTKTFPWWIVAILAAAIGAAALILM